MLIGPRGYERMIDANKEINDYREYHHQFRQFDMRKILGHLLSTLNHAAKGKN